jgi:flagellar basal body-associated protein FliL
MVVVVVVVVMVVVVVAVAAATAVVTATSVSLKIRRTLTVFNDFTPESNGNPVKTFDMYYTARHSSFHLNVGTR